jgi:hypothetical protein
MKCQFEKQKVVCNEDAAAKLSGSLGLTLHLCEKHQQEVLAMPEVDILSLNIVVDGLLAKAALRDPANKVWREPIAIEAKTDNPPKQLPAEQESR